MANSRSRSRSIDNLRWIGFQSDSLALAAGSTGELVAVSTAMPDTVMRTRGTLLAFLDGTSTPGVVVDVAVGLHVVPEGTGATVLQSPITDPNADWFWYDRFALAYEEGVTDVIEYSALPAYRTVIDSKAMRRVPPDFELQMVIEQATVAIGQSVNFFAAGRFLVGN